MFRLFASDCIKGTFVNSRLVDLTYLLILMIDNSSQEIQTNVDHEKAIGEAVYCGPSGRELVTIEGDVDR